MNKTDLRDVFFLRRFIILCIKANTDGESSYIILYFLECLYIEIHFSLDASENFVML